MLSQCLMQRKLRCKAKSQTAHVVVLMNSTNVMCVLALSRLGVFVWQDNGRRETPLDVASSQADMCMPTIALLLERNARRVSSITDSLLLVTAIAD